MYALFCQDAFIGFSSGKEHLKAAMDALVAKGYEPSQFTVYQKKAHVTYTVQESKLVID